MKSQVLMILKTQNVLASRYSNETSDLLYFVDKVDTFVTVLKSQALMILKTQNVIASRSNIESSD